MKLTTLAFNNARKAAKNAIADFAKPIYFDGIPTGRLGGIMENCGFDSADFQGVYCGRDGSVSIACPFKAFPKLVAYVNLSWHKMDVSGKMEITVYVS